jgi:RNA 2',3'-cyclic 3'-phosphodiesterase
MRLFVAVDLDDASREAIGAEQTRLRRALDAEGRPAWKWVRPDRMHLTLVFIGEVDAPAAETIVRAMRTDFHSPAFSLVFGGLGVFPAHGAPSVLWLGVTDGRAAAIALQQRVADRLASVGVAPERRAYHPHLTLARGDSASPADRRRVAALDCSGAIARIDACAVSVYQSRLSPAGPDYTTLVRTELRP